MKKNLSLIIIIVAFSLVASPVLAATGKISISPSTGSYKVGDSITASVHIDGGGQNFNATKASISVSSNLTIEGFTTGDCNLVYLGTPPSVSSLGFTGGILGGSIPACTIYSLTLKPILPGTGSITITNAQIKAEADATELLSSVENASYTIKDSSGLTTTPTPIQPSGIEPSSSLSITPTAIPHKKLDCDKFFLYCFFDRINIFKLFHFDFHHKK